MASTVLPSHSRHGHDHTGHSHAPAAHHSCSAADLSMLALLTSTVPSNMNRMLNHSFTNGPQRGRKVPDRRPQLDPLILETAAASGPQVTRNHYLHEFFPHSTPYYRCDIDGEDCQPVKAEPTRSRYVSQQAPRRQRLAREGQEAAEQRTPTPGRSNLATSREAPSKDRPEPAKSSAINAQPPRDQPAARRLSLVRSHDPSVVVPLLRGSESPTKRFAQLNTTTSPSLARGKLAGTTQSSTQTSRPPTLQVVCHARTRIPTPHGPVFLHLYRNNRDDKEHLAFVVDRNQFDNASPASDAAGEEVPSLESSAWLRSRSLDAEWRTGETEMERIVRGAYVGKLGSGLGQAVASKPAANSVRGQASSRQANDSSRAPRESLPGPLVRIHSECFTGETLGSQRCDCGEQLDEALRLLSCTPPYRGVVVYLRQEGRGIGLLSKLRAYNLQDLGHDTVTANLLLGHAADSRNYEVAAGILRDFGIHEIKLLTNNPDKVESVEREGLTVVQRVGMVPRQWNLSSQKARDRGSKSHQRHDERRRRERRALRGLRHQTELPGDLSFGGARGGSPTADEADVEDVEKRNTTDSDSDTSAESLEDDSELEALKRRAGVGMIGGGTTRSAELDKYLRTKVERMRHIITLPHEEVVVSDDDGSHQSVGSPAPLSQAPSRATSSLGFAMRQKPRSSAKLQSHAAAGLGMSQRPTRSRTLTQEDAPASGTTSGSEGETSEGRALATSLASLKTDLEDLTPSSEPGIDTSGDDSADESSEGPTGAR